MPLSAYPEDLTASLPGNYIIGETHTFPTPGDRIFVPNGSPFFLVDLEVRDTATNQLLSPGIDYYAMQPDKDAMMDSVKSVMTVLWVTKTTVTGVTLRYRAVGGQYQNMAAILVDFLESVPVGALGVPTWGTILNKPATFPPSQHNHLPNEWQGYTEVIILLEQIRVTLVSGDRPTLAAVYQYIDQNLTQAVTDYLGSIDLQQPVVYDPETSGFLGSGTDGDPLTLNLPLLDDRYSQVIDLPLTQIGKPNDFYLPVSAGYFSITGPKSGNMAGAASYIEANGDLLFLLPTTNGEVARVVYGRIRDYIGRASHQTYAPTDRLYRPPGLAANESVQAVYSPSENSMIVEIWHLAPGDSVETFLEHAIVLLNETFVDTSHQLIRIGNILIDKAGGTHVRVANLSPSALRLPNGDIYLTIYGGRNLIWLFRYTESGGSPVISELTTFNRFYRNINPTLGTFNDTADRTTDSILMFDQLAGHGLTNDHLVKYLDPDLGLESWGISTFWTPAGMALVQVQPTVFRITCFINVRINGAFGAGGVFAVSARQFCMTIDIDVTDLDVTEEVNYYRRLYNLAGEPLISTADIVDGTLTLDYRTDNRQLTPIASNVSTRYTYGMLANGDYYIFFIPSITSGTYAYNFRRRTSVAPLVNRLTASDPFNYEDSHYSGAGIGSEELYLRPPSAVVPLGNAWFIAPDQVFSREDRAAHNGSSTYSGAVTTIDLGGTRTYTLAGDGVIDGYPISAVRSDRITGVESNNVNATVVVGGSPSAKYGCGTFFPSSETLSHPREISYSAGNLIALGLIILPAAVNAQLTNDLLALSPSSTAVAWNLIIPTDQYSWTCMVSMYAITSAGEVTVSYYAAQITVTTSAPDVTITSVTVGALAFSATVSGTFVSITSNRATMAIGSAAMRREGDIIHWIVRASFNAQAGNGTGITDIRTFEEDLASPGTFTYLGAISGIGLRAIMPTAHPTLGLGYLAPDAGYGVFTKFVRYPADGFEWVVATPRPAEGYVLNVTEPITVLMGGVIRTIPIGTYNIQEQIANPASSTILVYVRLVAGMPELRFQLTPVAEGFYVTYLGSLVTDTNGVISSTLRAVTRLNVYRPSQESIGSAFAVSDGTPDQPSSLIWN